jgi:5-formyltetrahydrofolate cyclo-ligase
METSDLKAELRAAVRETRDTWVAGLPEAARALAFRAAPTPLRALFAPGRVIAGYVAIGSEADPARLLAQAAEAGATLALPYVERRSVPMRFLRWAPGEALVRGQMGLRQPDPARADEVAPDLFLAPLLAFDRRGHRLGQGAGYYDRAFARYTDALRIGLAWSCQEVDAVPDDPWDEPLHAIVTEKEWIA